MACPVLPYQVGDQWFVDKDPRNTDYYAANVFDDLVSRNTSVVSFTAQAIGVVLVETGLPQGVYGRLLPVMLSGMGAVGTASFCTFTVTCANGEIFVRTIHFNPVSD